MRNYTYRNHSTKEELDFLSDLEGELITNKLLDILLVEIFTFLSDIIENINSEEDTETIIKSRDLDDFKLDVKIMSHHNTVIEVKVLDSYNLLDRFLTEDRKLIYIENGCIRANALIEPHNGVSALDYSYLWVVLKELGRWQSIWLSKNYLLGIEYKERVENYKKDMHLLLRAGVRKYL